MRYIFILNPSAGDYSSAQMYAAYLKRYCEAKKLNQKTYVTEYKGHATKIVNKEAETGDYIRIYGFGGDGTLHEVAAGAIGFKNVEVGIFAFGSGNDFIKTFRDDLSIFRDIDAQLNGRPVTVDMIKSSDGSIALNQCSVGFDAKVALKMEQFKKWPLVSGPMAYSLAILKCAVFGKVSSKMTVTIDDKEVYTDDFLFVLAANGQYYGGGYKGAPNAKIDDGKLDFIIMKKINRLKFAKIIKYYQNGEHMESDLFKKYLIARRGRKIKMESSKPLVVTFDGECSCVNNISLEIMPDSLKFILPYKV